jgi:hypothetical protein
MATSTHYPPSLLPWQEPRTDADNFDVWHLELVEDARWHDPLAILYVERAPAGWWRWEIYSCESWRPFQASSIYGHNTYEECEEELLQALARCLHEPPSALLPPLGGGMAPWEEEDIA